MATFTEMQGRYIRVIRAVRKVYRTADTAGERLERELDRLIKRKRLIQPNDLSSALKMYNAYDAAVGNIARAFADATNWLKMPVL